MFELSVRTHFSAAHCLKGYLGKCASVHGHNWTVEVFVRGSRLNATGILVDFKQLRQVVKDALEQMDHVDLGSLPAFASDNPTSENIAMFIFGELARRLDCADYTVSRVTVNETPDTSASYWRLPA